MTDPMCHWNGQQRVLSSHVRECATAGCTGCLPCEGSHCRCGRHLGTSELHCARCVGKVRIDLDRISDLCLLAPTAATERGLDSPAVTLAGPVPRQSTAIARHRWAIGGALCRCATRGQTCPDDEVYVGPAHPSTECGDPSCLRAMGMRVCPDLVDWLEQTSDQRHPLTVLGSWDLAVTEHLGHGDRTMQITVDRAVSYLKANLTDLARDGDFAFEELAREVRDCRDHVENVMEVAIRPTKGAPCPVCHSAGRKARPLVREYDDDAQDDGLDRWVCPRSECGESWTIEEYDKYVEREHRSNAEHLTASQIAAEYRVPEGSTRGWATKGRVAKRGRDGAGRQLYDVGDVLACRDGAATASAS